MFNNLKTLRTYWNTYRNHLKGASLRNSPNFLDHVRICVKTCQKSCQPFVVTNDRCVNCLRSIVGRWIVCFRPIYASHCHSFFNRKIYKARFVELVLDKLICFQEKSFRKIVALWKLCDGVQIRKRMTKIFTVLPSYVFWIIRAIF